MLAAHIAGVPVEETALTMVPVATLLGGVALRNIRHGVSQRVGKARRRREPAGQLSASSRRP
ncbi:MAG TPA: hypothetical protein VFI09_10675 [Solirubrobacterales bacterium]|nr:hypothetical protein [Solirubrobacterales bacterium]